MGAESVLERCLMAVDRLDASGLSATLAVASTALSMEEFLDGVVAPLLEEIGRRWEAGRLTVAHEHVASVVVRQILGGMIGAWADRAAGPTLVIGTPSGERHEFGAMMVAATAVAAGWRVVYVGADVPVDSLVAAARAQEALAVALSVVAPPSLAAALDDVFRLRQALPDGVTILVGGRAVGPGTVEAVAGATYLVSLADVRRLLARLGGSAATRSG